MLHDIHLPFRRSLALLVALFMLSLAGCGDSNLFEGIGDKSSKEARTEAALMAMDDGDYQSAISILTALVQNHPGDAQLLQYLSSAYSGAAGLDTLSILEVLDRLDAAGESGDIDMIGLVLGDASGQLTSEEVAAKLAYINSAIDQLLLIPNRNDDQTIQLGVVSMTRFSLTMADLIMTERNRSDVVLTEEGIDGLYPDAQPPAFDFVDATDVPAALEEDLANIHAATLALENLSAESNDLVQDFTDFQNAFDQGGDGQISSSDLENYINNLNP